MFLYCYLCQSVSLYYTKTKSHLSLLHSPWLAIFRQTFLFNSELKSGIPKHNSKGTHSSSVVGTVQIQAKDKVELNCKERPTVYLELKSPLAAGGLTQVLQQLWITAPTIPGPYGWWSSLVVVDYIGCLSWNLWRDLGWRMSELKIYSSPQIHRLLLFFLCERQIILRKLSPLSPWVG